MHFIARMQKIKAMTDEQLLIAFVAIPDFVQAHTSADVLYDKVKCESLGIDYKNVGQRDYFKAMVFASG